MTKRAPIFPIVIPAKAGIQLFRAPSELDSGLRRNDMVEVMESITP